MSLITEIVEIEQFVKATFPLSKTEKQTIPKQPSADLFVVRFLKESRTDETRFHYRVERDYQIIYFSQYAEDGLSKLDAFNDAVESLEILTDTNTRMMGFGYGQPTLTDNDLYATVGILNTVVRQSRPQKQYEKINHLHNRF